jgi:lactate dehydrogenase-like 2-hydroxyacid dehydrogenase
MTVIIAERKGVKKDDVREGRMEFTEAIRTATTLMITCPLNSSTRHMITSTEFQLMRKDAILVNVARGGIVVEEDLVDALKGRIIAGAATDVFENEPAGLDNDVLVREAPGLGGRLTLSPHLAWYAKSSIEKLKGTVRDNIEAFARGEPRNLVV